MEEHCYGSWIQRTVNVLVSLKWSPSGRKELVKNQPCLSAKIFLSGRPLRPFLLPHGSCLRDLVLLVMPVCSLPLMV